jgi:glucose/mannose transport system permease protein
MAGRADVRRPSRPLGGRFARLMSERTVATLLILPSVVAVVVFVYGFIAWSSLVSVSDWHTVRADYSFVGRNFENCSATSLPDNIVTPSSSLMFVACLVIGFTLASLLDPHRGEGLGRTSSPWRYRS